MYTVICKIRYKHSDRREMRPAVVTNLNKSVSYISDYKYQPFLKLSEAYFLNFL